MTNLKEKRLEDFKVSQLFPINILVENKKKNLSISLNMFKICRLFPKEEMGHMKKIQKETEKNNVSQMCYNKNFSELTEDETVEVKKYLNKRASSPTRTSPYVKFLVKSLIMTNYPEVKFASFEEELNNSWCFSLNNRSFDITTNVLKQSENCLYFDSNEVLDKDGLIKENCLNYVNSILPFQTNLSVVSEASECLNKLRNQFLTVYNIQLASDSLSEEIEIMEHTLQRSS